MWISRKNEVEEEEDVELTEKCVFARSFSLLKRVELSNRFHWNAICSIKQRASLSIHSPSSSSTEKIVSFASFSPLVLDRTVSNPGPFFLLEWMQTTGEREVLSFWWRSMFVRKVGEEIWAFDSCTHWWRNWKTKFSNREKEYWQKFPFHCNLSFVNLFFANRERERERRKVTCLSLSLSMCLVFRRAIGFWERSSSSLSLRGVGRERVLVEVLLVMCQL